ncbi:endogenous retrovirus group K member 104 Rec protein-like isoform X4 [Lepus europaeus]|uniref:endogenous retrovirus group K member 104 Rec protein-like isoform X4 n=1 Tax=Lepus europaeus TaxID=9983 RepID=UPI002B48D18A|nr:endogenous retrovirus group K member 104 Rec protein-like isoform X4 [Lepus europaeus]
MFAGCSPAGRIYSLVSVVLVQSDQLGFEALARRDTSGYLPDWGSLAMAKRVRCDCDPPVEEMRNLTLRMAVGPTLRTRQAHPPTWGQLKKLNQEADKILVRTGKPKTAVTMCLAMLAVLEMSTLILRYFMAPF